jgi:hypothetical protein
MSPETVDMQRQNRWLFGQSGDHGKWGKRNVVRDGVKK